MSAILFWPHCVDAVPFLCPFQVFRYSSSSDCLELCLEPHGHFPVESGIEDRILGTAIWKEGSPKKDTTMTSLRSSREIQAEKEVKQALTVGSSGIILDKTMKYPKPAFTGQGHTLSGSVGGQGQSSGQGASTSESAQGGDTAAETGAEKTVEEGMDTTEDAAEDSEFVRVGPGCTVLNYRKTNAANETSEQFKTLAAAIESAVKDSENQNEAVVEDNSQSVDSIPVSQDLAMTEDSIETSTAAVVSDVDVMSATEDDNQNIVNQDSITEANIVSDDAKNVMTMDVEVPSSVDNAETGVKPSGGDQKMETVSSGGDTVTQLGMTSVESDMEAVVTSAGESSHQKEEVGQKTTSETMDST